MQRYLLKLRTFVYIGDELSELSVCKRKQVAAIVFPTDCSRIYAIGYNGPPRGFPNDTCSNEEGNCGCVHAEANAIAKFNSETAKPSIMYVTCRPCVHCAGLILNCDKIVGLIWGEAYRDVRGIDLIIKSNRIDVVPSTSLWSDTIAKTILRRWKAMT